MDQYRKGRNVEEPLDVTNLPFKNVDNNVLWMHVKGGSKIRNLLTHACNKFPNENPAVVWTGVGPAMSKAISCAEIMKRQFPNTYQSNKICYRKVEEFWEPQLDGLEELVVVRNVPMIHILLSFYSVEKNNQGTSDFRKNVNQKNKD